jgi:transcriptional regulator with XRE-family HTH domain
MQALQKQVGARIRELREKKGVSQEALAALCNLHRTYIGLIERGERNLSLSAIETVAGALDVPVAELFQDVQPAVRAKARKSPAPKQGTASLQAELAAIRRILIDAQLVDPKRYAALVKANSQD